MDDQYFLLNVNEGRDTLHDPERLDERCNTDDVVGRKRVDPWSAEALLAKGDAVACGWCKPEPRG